MGDKTITFSGPPVGLQRNDTLLIFDKENYTFSRSRPYYRQGEMPRVLSVSGSVVTLSNPVYADYSATALTTIASINATAGELRVSVEKIVPSYVALSGMSMVFRPQYRGISIVRGANTRLTDLYLTNTDIALLTLRLCKDVVLSNVHGLDTNPLVTVAVGGTFGYGLSVNNCQDVVCDGNTWEAHRHGITLGGGGTEYTIPNRNIRFTGGSSTNNISFLLYQTTVDMTLGSTRIARLRRPITSQPARP
jgi:hypothetical protein